MNTIIVKEISHFWFLNKKSPFKALDGKFFSECGAPEGSNKSDRVYENVETFHNHELVFLNNLRDDSPPLIIPRG